jgi:hypothetical protein
MSSQTCSTRGGEGFFLVLVEFSGVAGVDEEGFFQTGEFGQEVVEFLEGDAFAGGVVEIDVAGAEIVIVFAIEQAVTGDEHQDGVVHRDFGEKFPDFGEVFLGDFAVGEEEFLHLAVGGAGLRVDAGQDVGGVLCGIFEVPFWVSVFGDAHGHGVEGWFRSRGGAGHLSVCVEGFGNGAVEDGDLDFVAPGGEFKRDGALQSLGLGIAEEFALLAVDRHIVHIDAQAVEGVFGIAGLDLEGDFVLCCS